jgi:hypothetical protein
MWLIFYIFLTLFNILKMDTVVLGVVEPRFDQVINFIKILSAKLNDIHLNLSELKQNHASNKAQMNDILNKIENLTILLNK